MATKSKAPPEILQRGVSEPIALEKLLLDEKNPRFGDSATRFGSQRDVLDWIVTNFGVEDVISSLAINGYFEAEPLVVESVGDGTYIVKEGNRRLAACLILANDPRAKNQARKREGALKVTDAKNWTPKKKVPAIRFEKADARSLTAYLGVRHIVSAQPWDSFAKAAWISSVVETSDFSLDEIAQLTGDKSQTIAKLLEGYNFVKQLRDDSLFDPESSQKRGRGSNVAFPFSWVYTLLQYSGIRNWLELGTYSADPKPIPKGREKDAAMALEYMFGNSTSSRPPRIEDSRQIGDLAYALTVPERRELLNQGHTVREVEEMSRPALDRLMGLVVDARTRMRAVNSILGERSLSADDATELLEVLRDVRKSTGTAFKTLTVIVDGEDADD